MDEIALGAGDAHIGDHPPRTRMRLLGVTIGVHDADDALLEPHGVIGDGEERIAVVALGLVVGRYIIADILGQKLEPILELPIIQQSRFVKEEILDFRAARRRDSAGLVHQAPSIRRFQWRQKMRR